MIHRVGVSVDTRGFFLQLTRGVLLLCSFPFDYAGSGLLGEYVEGG